MKLFFVQIAQFVLHNLYVEKSDNFLIVLTFVENCCKID